MKKFFVLDFFIFNFLFKLLLKKYDFNKFCPGHHEFIFSSKNKIKYYLPIFCEYYQGKKMTYQTKYSVLGLIE